MQRPGRVGERRHGPAGGRQAVTSDVCTSGVASNPALPAGTPCTDNGGTAATEPAPVSSAGALPPAPARVPTPRARLAPARLASAASPTPRLAPWWQTRRRGTARPTCATGREHHRRGDRQLGRAGRRRQRVHAGGLQRPACRPTHRSRGNGLQPERRLDVQWDRAVRDLHAGFPVHRRRTVRVAECSAGVCGFSLHRPARCRRPADPGRLPAEAVRRGEHYPISVADNTDVRPTTASSARARPASGRPGPPPLPLARPAAKSERSATGGELRPVRRGHGLPGERYRLRHPDLHGGDLRGRLHALRDADLGPDPRDCMKKVCDGAGNVTSIEDNTDVPAGRREPVHRRDLRSRSPRTPAPSSGTAAARPAEPL